MAKAATQRTTTATPSASRYEELKRMLDDRQRELVAEVQGRIRSVRADGAEKPHERMVPFETSEIDHQDLDLALIQMKAETLNKINEARWRLEEHRYGMCFECGDEIAEARLRALPFAVRCKDCEEAREMEDQRLRTQARRRGIGSLFEDQRG
jgi:DnaK suppressor protein